MAQVAGVLALSFLAALALWAFGQAATLWKPWRTRQINGLVLAGILAAAAISTSLHKSPRLSTIWTGILIAAACAGLGLATTRHRRHRLLSLPPGDEAGWPEALPDPVLPFYRPGDDPVATASLLLADIELKRWRTYRGEHPTRAFQKHSLFVIDSLLAAYERTHRQQFLKAAEEVVDHWIRHNSAWVFSPPNPFSWGDHSTALRLCRLIAFWNHWALSVLYRNALAELIRRSALGHAKLLATPSFYWARHNHGIDQDIALIQASLFLPQAKAALEWRDIAWRRLWANLDALVSPRGVLREHSPGYQLSTLTHLSALANLARRQGWTSHADRLAELTKRMAAFAANLIDPSGDLTPFGDTDRNVSALRNEALQHHRIRDPHLAYCLSGGAQGEDPGAVVSYADDGYVFLREPVGDNRCSPDAWYLAFSGASHLRGAHKHLDDLSFVLTGHGVPLVTDPGRYSYSADAWRRFFVSREGHNTVALGWTQDRVSDFPIGDGQTITHPVEDLGKVILIGGRHRMEEAMHERAVAWIRGRGLIVVDLVTHRSGGGHGLGQPAELFWHLGELVRARAISDRTMILQAPETGEKLATVWLHAPMDGRWRVVSGVTNPIQGWLSPGRDLKRPGEVLMASSLETPAVFVTEFALLQPADRLPLDERSPAVNGKITLAEGVVDVPFSAGGALYTLRMIPGEAPRLIFRPTIT